MTALTTKVEIDKASIASSKSWLRFSLEDMCLAFAFAICIGLFLIGTIANCLSKRVSLDENRLPCSFPHLRLNSASIKAFPRGFESYFNDRFCSRKQLVMGGSLLKLGLFHVTGNPAVLVGKEGHFFCAAGNNPDLIRRGRPFSHENLLAWKCLLERRTKWCHEHGFDYLFVLTPSKASIYPELLPYGYSDFSGPTRTDQLVKFLDETHSMAKVVDLRAALKVRKGREPLYYKTDDHWNQLGAYYGYRALIDWLRLRYAIIPAPKPLSQFVIYRRKFDMGGLARMQGLLGVLTEENLAMWHCIPFKSSMTKYALSYENKFRLEDTRPFYYSLNGSNLPQAVLFRDSFASDWGTLFLADHFSKIAFYWQPEFSERIILKEKPNIVIQELLELCLYENVPTM